MLRLSDIKLPLDHSPEAIRQAVLAKLGLADKDLLSLTLFKRGNDARKKHAIQLVYTLDVEVRNEAALLKRFARDPNVRTTPDMEYKFVARAPAMLVHRPLVIGAGPCGLFAALLLAQMGFRPIILERGKKVRERTKDTWGLWRKSVLDTTSNVQFGEGGAGTFSDGKLYSQIKDPRHLGRKVLSEFVKAGAPEDILTEAHPHIGTFRLVKMVENMRATIEALGGEYRWQSKVVDIEIEEREGFIPPPPVGGRPGGGRNVAASSPDNLPHRANDSLDRYASPLQGEEKTVRRVTGVLLESGERIAADHVVLAVGHSARDTFAMLAARGVALHAKPFSIGFRIEHPQSIIDRARFGPGAGHPILGAADYKLVHHASNGRDVYSFCMCPGGTVVAATSEEGRVVTNGMSQYSRAERNANAGIVVGITPADYPEGPLAGIDFQRRWESAAFEAGGRSYAAPAQRVGDFLAGRPSKSLGDVVPSYKPGVTPTDLSTCLPDYAIAAIREALPAFGRQIQGFDMADAVLTGVETRTSSPLRIPRGDDFQSLNTQGLYPAGEGAGYAGGILSAGVDGIKVAESVALSICII